jgi:hypothetical protein
VSLQLRSKLALYDQMAAEAARRPGLLVAFANDLHVHDRATLERTQPGDDLLWILQDAGTALLPLSRGYDPQLALYWIGPGYQSLPEERRPRAYHLAVHANAGASGTVREISYEDAEILARAPLSADLLRAADALLYARAGVVGRSVRSGWPARPAANQAVTLADPITSDSPPARLRITWRDASLGACTATVTRDQLYAPLGPALTVALAA